MGASAAHVEDGTRRQELNVRDGVDASVDAVLDRLGGASVGHRTALQCVGRFDGDPALGGVRGEIRDAAPGPAAGRQTLMQSAPSATSTLTWRLISSGVSATPPAQWIWPRLWVMARPASWRRGPVK